MYRGSLAQRWRTLTQFQQIAILVVGALILYALVAAVAQGRISLGLILALATIIFVAFPVHEFAHAAAAVALGDDTPKRQGRYTLNPLPHIDPLGAGFLVLTSLSGWGGFGWARPVQWNPRNINVNPKVGAIMVALAGPLSNLAMAVVAALIIRNIETIGPVSNFLGFFIRINVLLFVFNLIPIPPLDGSHVLFALLPGDTFRLRAQLSQYGFLFLMLVIFFAPYVVLGPARFIENLLLTGLPG